MKKNIFSEEQIMSILKKNETGIPIEELAKKYGFCEQTFYRWKSKFGGMKVSNARKLRKLEEENRGLKQLVGELFIDNQALKWVARPRISEPLVLDKANQRWSMDFVSDTTALWNRISILTVIDTFTRECLALEVDTSITGSRVSRLLDRIGMERGYPEEILTDKGPEFTGKAMDSWAYIRGITHRLIEPGKPSQNGDIESFNGKLRDGCLNEHWFLNLRDARNMIGEWQRIYNEKRPHSSLDNLIPSKICQENRGKRRSPLCLKISGNSHRNWT